MRSAQTTKQSARVLLLLLLTTYLVVTMVQNPHFFNNVWVSPQQPQQPAHSSATTEIVVGPEDLPLQQPQQPLRIYSSDQNLVGPAGIPFQKKMKNNKVDGERFSHCYFRKYPIPDLNASLPILGEVFASHDSTQVFLAAEGRKYCQVEYDEAHNFFAVMKDGKLLRPGVQFDCLFEDDRNNRNGSSSTTISLPVHPRRNDNMGAGFVLIQCPIPEHLRGNVPTRGAPVTFMHMALRARTDVRTGQRYAEEEAPTLMHLPVCSHVWPTEEVGADDGEQQAKPLSDNLGRTTKKTTNHNTHTLSPRKKHKYRVSLMTRVSTSYKRGSDNEQLSITKTEFIAWVEYHLAIGIEHFYIYDDSLSPQNSTIHMWCRPYILQGVVTYIHYPYRDIDCNNPNYPRPQYYVAQVISSNCVLRRYEHESEYIGHWDVDELLVLSSVHSPQDMQQFLDRTLQPQNPRQFLHHQFQQAAIQPQNLRQFLHHKIQQPEIQEWDELNFESAIYGKCLNNHSGQDDPQHDNVQLAMEQKRCRNTFYSSKGLYRTHTVLHFRVHRAQISMNHTRIIRRRRFQPDTAHIAHFRNGQAAGDSFPEDAQSVFEPWIPLIKQRVREQLL